MNKVLNTIVGLAVIICNVCVAGYFFIYLISHLNNSVKYPLERLEWFVYFFIWDIWLNLLLQRLNESQNNSDSEE